MAAQHSTTIDNDAAQLHARRVADAAANNNTAQLRALLDAGTNANTPLVELFDGGCHESHCALFWAIRYNCSDACALLLRKGANPNTQEVWFCCRQLCCCYIYTSTVQYGNTALMFAIKPGCVQILSLLLHYGAHVNQEPEVSAICQLFCCCYIYISTPQRGNTALLLAIKTQCVNTVLLLLHYGADVNQYMLVLAVCQLLFCNG